MSEINTHNFMVLADGHNLKNLKKLVEKVNKKAARYGAEPIKMEVGERRLQEFEVPASQAEIDFGRCGGRMKMRTIKEMVQDVSIEYTEVKIKGGWYVLGSIERMADSKWSIVNGNVDKIGDYKQYDFTWCDHCNKHRNRKKMIILENKKGERKVVGRQCVVDYLGISIAHAIFAADFAAYIAKMFAPLEICEGDGGWFEGGNAMRLDVGPDLEDLAILTTHIMKKDKWTYRSAKGEEYGEVSTASVVSNIYYSALKGDKDARKEVESIEDDTIEQAKDFLNSLKEEFSEDRIPELDNSFDYDFAVMLAAGHALRERQFIGMFGYRLSKKMAENTVKHDPKKSEYYGSIGDKIKGVDVEVTRTRLIEGHWGDSLMICGFFKGTDDQFVTFNSGNTDWLYNDDDTIKDEVKIAATVKNHQDRGYGKQTVLTRVRLAK
jgi:hypothetical protein